MNKKERKEKRRKEPLRVVFSGWYGHGNLGDEAILAAAAGGLRARGHEVAVLSFFPEKTAALHGVKAYPQLPAGFLRRVKGRMFGDLKESYRLIERADVFALGGGGFLSDWQPEAVRWWLSQLETAEQLGTSAMLYAVGAGPFFTPRGKFAALDYISRNAAGATVRDEFSKKALVADCGVAASRVSVTADPAISLEPNSDDLPEAPARLRRENAPRPLVGLFLTPHFDNEECWGKETVKRKWPRLRHAYRVLTEKLLESGEADVLLFCAQWQVDRPLAEELSAGSACGEEEAKEGGPRIYVQPREWTPAESLSALACCRAVLSVRLHGCILAAAAGVPSVGIVYHPKTDDFLRAVGQRERALEIGEGKMWPEADLDGEEAAARLLRLLAEADSAREVLLPRVKVLRKKEAGNRRVLENIGGLAKRGRRL